MRSGQYTVESEVFTVVGVNDATAGVLYGIKADFSDLRFTSRQEADRAAETIRSALESADDTVEIATIGLTPDEVVEIVRGGERV